MSCLIFIASTEWLFFLSCRNKTVSLEDSLSILSVSSLISNRDKRHNIIFSTDPKMQSKITRSQGWMFSSCDEALAPAPRRSGGLKIPSISQGFWPKPVVQPQSRKLHRHLWPSWVRNLASCYRREDQGSQTPLAIDTSCLGQFRWQHEPGSSPRAPLHWSGGTIVLFVVKCLVNHPIPLLKMLQHVHHCSRQKLGAFTVRVFWCRTLAFISRMNKAAFFPIHWKYWLNNQRGISETQSPYRTLRLPG